MTENYLESELRSLGVECKGKNEFNEEGQLEVVGTALEHGYLLSFFFVSWQLSSNSSSNIKYYFKINQA